MQGTVLPILIKGQWNQEEMSYTDFFTHTQRQLVIRRAQLEHSTVELLAFKIFLLFSEVLRGDKEVRPGLKVTGVTVPGFCHHCCSLD